MRLKTSFTKNFQNDTIIEFKTKLFISIFLQSVKKITIIIVDGFQFIILISVY